MTWSATNERLFVAELNVHLAVHRLGFFYVVKFQYPVSITARRCSATNNKRILNLKAALRLCNALLT